MRIIGFITDSPSKINGKQKQSYNRWYKIIQRCYNENSKDYKYYGAKGVTICDEWRRFSVFEKWFDENYIEGYDIDKDLNGDKIYSPENCVFVSKSENIREANYRRDYSHLSTLYSGSGNNMFGRKSTLNPNFKHYSEYKTSPTTRDHFKRACKTNSWNFEDFDEIYSGSKSGSNKKYFYIKKEGR